MSQPLRFWSIWHGMTLMSINYCPLSLIFIQPLNVYPPFEYHVAFIDIHKTYDEACHEGLILINGDLQKVALYENIRKWKTGLLAKLTEAK